MANATEALLSLFQLADISFAVKTSRYSNCLICFYLISGRPDLSSFEAQHDVPPTFLRIVFGSISRLWQSQILTRRGEGLTTQACPPGDSPQGAVALMHVKDVGATACAPNLWGRPRPPKEELPTIIEANRLNISWLARGVSAMCDYSLHFTSSRPARIGDTLITTAFANSTTRGLSAVGEPNVAVCLLPGTEVAFEDEVAYNRAFGLPPKGQISERVARFRQIDREQPDVHHDAFEFPRGEIVKVHRLCPGQRVIVLQLPTSVTVRPEESELEPSAFLV